MRRNNSNLESGSGQNFCYVVMFAKCFLRKIVWLKSVSFLEMVVFEPKTFRTGHGVGQSANNISR